MRTVVYARVSTLDQATEGVSLETQIDACRRKAVEMGASSIQVLEDAYTGTSLARPAMERLRDQVANGDVDVVVVYDPDRFSRDLADLLIVSKEFERAGVRLEYVNFAWDHTPQGTLFLQVRGAFAQFEHAMILERTSRGKARRSAEGKPMHFLQPYGYSHVRGKGITVNPDTAPVVQRIFDLYTNQGWTINDICRLLVAEGVPGPRGANWGVSSIHYILTNRSYLGEVERSSAKPEWQPIKLEPLISEELFERTQALKASRRRRPRRQEERPEFLFQGQLHCGVCGRLLHIHVQIRTSGTGRHRYLYYKCPDRWQGRVFGRVRHCTGPSVSATKLDAQIWGVVASLLADPDLFYSRLHNPESLAIVQDRLEHARAQVMKFEQALVRLEESYLEQDIPADRYRSYKRKYRDSLAEAKAGLRRVEASFRAAQDSVSNLASLQRLAEEYGSSLDTLSFATRRAIVTALITDVVVTEQEAVISFVGALAPSTIALAR